MGGEPRDGDTIATILAGWDLLCFDAAPEDWSSDPRLTQARAIARPLIQDAAEAREDGEGECCLRHLLTHQIILPNRGATSVGELIAEAIARGASTQDLHRLGLRYRPQQADLVLPSGHHKALYAVFRGERWSDGGHVAALLSLEGVEKLPNPISIGGSKYRALSIPARYLPEPETNGTAQP
jgi:hypothetical protein